jgi:predicted acylesterase/phospholipase RssA
VDGAEYAEPVAPVAPPASARELLDLQKMEVALIRATNEEPQLLSEEVTRRLRYLLRFARLATTARNGDEHRQGPAIKHFRTQVLQKLRPALREEPHLKERLMRAHAALGALGPALDDARALLPAPELSALDAEIERKRLVSVAGGGGGAGFVYIGAWMALYEAGIAPEYVIGASIGAIIGMFPARAAIPDWDRYLHLARTLRAADLFAPPTLERRYGLPGLVQVRLRKTFGELLSRADGELLRIGEMPVRYEAVVAGVKSRSFDRLPSRFREPAGARVDAPNMLARARLGAAVASRMWQVAAFFDPRVVEPVVLGADELTARLRVVDAAGFSASIPGVLHYDIPEPDPETQRVLDTLFEERELAALVDGGVTANVPAALAWKRLQSGVIGTRNAFLLAFDCFHPTWDPKNLWLQPITQAISLQRLQDVPYADWVLRFDKALSPVTLVPSPATVDQAIAWGREATRPLIPMLAKALEPVWWDQRPREQAAP